MAKQSANIVLFLLLYHTFDKELRFFFDFSFLAYFYTTFNTYIMQINATLLNWYQQNKRLLPWRDTQDAYAIWVSEIILQQTRVAQGLEYYHRFLSTFPTVCDLASADETEVLRIWQGLGYYSRARNMHKAAKLVVSEYNGVFPTQYEQLLQLPGIGAYTAAAIASFSSNAPHAAVDGNVYRVLARIFGIDTPIDSTAGKKLFATLAQEQLDLQQPGTYNQAMMDFGALQCTPTHPNCPICPFAEACMAARTHTVEQLPVKTKKLQQRTRHFWYIDIHHNGNTYLQQRPAGDIWQGLYEPYLIEGEYNENTITSHPFFQEQPGTISYISPVFKHVLSHQIILAHFLRYEIQDDTLLPASLQKISGTAIEDYPVPQLIVRYRLLSKR